jgi:NtrC-family two-component system sensor histidine kinase KinB
MRTSLRTQLRLGLGAMAVAIALLSVAAVLSLNRLGGAVSTILRDNYASVSLCEQMEEALERQDSATFFAVSGHEEIAGPMLTANQKSFAEALDREERNITVPGEDALVRSIRARYGEYLAQVDRVLALPPEARQEAYFRDLLPRFTRVKEPVKEVLRLNQETMEAADRAAKSLSQRTVRAALAVSLAAVIFATWFAYWLPRAVVRPVVALTSTVRSIGEGNFDVKVEGPQVDELKPLVEAFNMMLERLRAYRESSLGELLAAKDLARSTLECMLDPVIVFDRDGTVRFTNAAAQEALGLKTGTAHDLRTANVTVPGAIEDARDQVFATRAPVLPHSLSEAMRWRGLDGEKYYLVRAAPLQAGPKDTPSAIVVAQDVTRFHRIDELKSDMVATVSHQFKTPLTSLRMATHLLLEPGTGPLTESQRELVTTARDDTERLRTMVEDLLDVVRIESEAGALRRIPVEPFGLLCEVADAHRTVAREKDVALAVDPSAQQGLLSIDPERLSIALSNLVSNAIRHTPGGGRITLGASRGDHALRITVSDTGEGILPKDLPRIFDRRSSSSGDGDGRDRHGLGLTIAREIVRQHGGELTAASEPGKGSVFTLELPLSEGR